MTSISFLIKFAFFNFLILFLNVYLGFEPPPSLPNNAIEAARNLARMAQEFSVSQPDRSK